MQIVSLLACHVRIPLRSTIRHASFERSDTDSLIVACQLASGHTGWGEGLPRPYVTGETIDTAFEHLAHSPLADQLRKPISCLPDLVARCRDLTLTHPRAPDRDCFGNSVRCAIELAVLDAGCRALGLPLSAVTGQVPEARTLVQSLPRVRYSGALTAAPLWKVSCRTLAFRAYGFEHLKIKVGVPGTSDPAVIRRVRSLAGRQCDLRIDANEAWSCDSLAERLAPLLPSRLSAVEQPVPHAEVAGLAPLRARIGLPIMLDESLCSLADAKRAIDLGTCDLFNLRLSKCGGFIPTLEIAALARQHGIGCQLGCQVGETGLLSAAGRHFASSVAGLHYLEGSYDRFLVRERLTVEDISFGRGGWAPALAGPGLGVTLDPAALARVVVKSHPIPIA